MNRAPNVYTCAITSCRRLRSSSAARSKSIFPRSYSGWASSRRLFASPERRRHVDAARRKEAAEAVAETMGHMKGAFMKLGQMLSFVSDEVPEEFRTALAALQAGGDTPRRAGDAQAREKLAELEKASIPAAPLHSPQQALDDAHIKATGFLQDVDYPGLAQPAPVATTPIDLSASPGELRRRPERHVEDRR